MPTPQPTIDDALALLTEGPRDEDDLVEELDLPEGDGTWSFMEGLLDDRRVVELGDGRVALRSSLLVDGVVAWHRLSGDEVAARTVAPGVDAVLHLVGGQWVHGVRIGGENVTVSVWLDDEGPDPDRGPALRLPEGWAADLSEGDLVAFVADEEGASLVTATDPRAVSEGVATERAGDLLRDTLSMVADYHGSLLWLLRDPGQPTEEQWVLDLDEVAPLLLADHRPVVRDLGLPLVEALAESGLTYREGAVGGPGVSEAQLGLYVLGRDLVGDRVELAEDPTEACEAAGLAWGALVGAGSFADEVADRVGFALRVALDVPVAVEAVVDNLRSVDDHHLDAISVRVNEAHAADPGAPGQAWLAAEALLARGESRRAFEILSATIGEGGSRPDREWRGAWETLATLRGVAGDIAGAIMLFERLSEPGVVRRLSQWRSEPPRGVGRNERCPCGSGRKFKQCCLVHPAPLDLDARVPALWWKFETWVVRYHGDHVPRPDLDVSDASMGGVWMFGYDAHLVEDGAMAEIVDEVGELLPADERALVDQWLTRDRSLWEVVSVAAGGEARLRDLLRGEQVEVAAAPLEGAAAGDLLMALVVPGATGEHLVGHAIRVPFGARDHVLEVLAGEPDGQDVVDLVADLARPPTMTTPDGDLLVLHAGRWRVDELDAAISALDRTWPRAGEELEWPDIEHGESVRWSLRVDGGELVGSTLSDARWDELEEMVDRVLPDAALVDHEVQDAGDLVEAARARAGDAPAAGGDVGGDIDEDMDAEMDEVLQQLLRQKEVEWCDEPVPALGGVTPRAAVTDPTRRDDVIALLRSFRTPVTPTMAGRGFDADRIAALLGISDEL